MFVENLKTEKIKLYSVGIEKKYEGQTVEYDDNFITFLYFYYPSLIRLYIIDGTKEKDFIPQVHPKVNKICSVDNLEARRMKRFINERLKESDRDIFRLPQSFYREAALSISGKEYLTKLTLLFLKYKGNL